MKLKSNNKYDYLKIAEYLMDVSLSEKKLYKRQLKIIKEFDNIFNDIPSAGKVILLELFQKYNILRDTLINKIDFFINYIVSSNIYSHSVIILYIKIIKDNMKSFEQIKEITKASLSTNFFKTKNVFYNQNIFDLDDIELFQLKEFILSYYNSNKQSIIDNTVKKNIMETNNNNISVVSKYDDVYQLFFNAVFEEIMINENANIMDFNYTNEGAYSIVYEIKNTVLKIGSLRCTHNIPNSKFILQPLIRMELKDIYGYIEIENKVQTHGIGDEDVYNIYASLRDIGITWFDPGIRNLGILLKDNYPIYNNEFINMNQTFNGFDKNNEETLKAGNYVIDDLDTLSNEKYFDFGGEDVTSLCLVYENRYQRERKK